MKKWGKLGGIKVTFGQPAESFAEDPALGYHLDGLHGHEADVDHV